MGQLSEACNRFRNKLVQILDRRGWSTMPVVEFSFPLPLFLSRLSPLSEVSTTDTHISNQISLRPNSLCSFSLISGTFLEPVSRQQYSCMNSCCTREKNGFGWGVEKEARKKIRLKDISCSDVRSVKDMSETGAVVVPRNHKMEDLCFCSSTVF